MKKSNQKPCLFKLMLISCFFFFCKTELTRGSSFTFEPNLSIPSSKSDYSILSGEKPKQIREYNASLYYPIQQIFEFLNPSIAQQKLHFDLSLKSSFYFHAPIIEPPYYYPDNYPYIIKQYNLVPPPIRISVDLPVILRGMMKIKKNLKKETLDFQIQFDTQSIQTWANIIELEIGKTLNRELNKHLQSTWVNTWIRESFQFSPNISFLKLEDTFLERLTSFALPIYETAHSIANQVKEKILTQSMVQKIPMSLISLKHTLPNNWTDVIWKKSRDPYVRILWDLKNDLPL